ncbi:4a-hydroxytetrahydrobiopterin dehydratase [Herbaspirillum lusitanum]|jgi:4a-hydroxytetrahydrobiopterin dehydratase|uniref:Putative pterin-4-alpha-carbinolamine dehydratase n=1 Tax=Herbaspirillum lusitanum TaxID=213312 RepID=A0ABW9AB91_9BURK
MTSSATELATRHCTNQTEALGDADIKHYLATVEGWKIDGGKIAKSYDFKNYYETLAFVNAVAYIFHAEDHHPDLAVSYNRCGVRFDTHSVNGGKGGLSINDFICAAKVDAVFAQRSA